MHNFIEKERTYLFSPACNVALACTIEGPYSNDQLIMAIKDAIEHHVMLRTKIAMEPSGAAWYQQIQDSSCTITTTDKDIQQIISEQEAIRFRIEQGELVRFFILSEGLLIYAHHLAGDGLSFVFLLDDIMASLCGNRLEYSPLTQYSIRDLPAGTELPWLTKQLVTSQNKRWQTSGTVFSFEDGNRMFNEYWKGRTTETVRRTIEGKHLQALLAYGKNHEVSINSLITTALIKAAGEPSDVGEAASIRKDGDRSMGLLATGISIQYDYDRNKTFEENARHVQSLIQAKLMNPKKKFFLLRFLGSLSPTLLDSAYFAAYDGYQNKIAKRFQKLFGYEGNPKSISFTNLTRVPIKASHGAYHLRNLTFIPPLVPNSRRIIGCVTLGDTLSITFHVHNDEHLQSELQFFHEAIEILQGL